MFVHMSIHYPNPGQDDFIIKSMHRYAAAMKGKPGHQRVHVLRDTTTGKLIGMAFWNSKEEWQAARLAMEEAIKNDPLHEWEDVPPKVYHLVEV